MNKSCSKCGVEDDEKNFQKHSRICKNCKKQYAKEYRKNNNDKIRAYRKEHAEESNEYYKEYRKNNINIIKIKAKEYRELHSEEIKSKKSKYYFDNHDREREKHTQYYFDNIDKVNNRKLVKEFGITLAEYMKLFDKQHGKCAVCGRDQKECSRSFAVDHIHIEGYKYFSSEEKKKYVRGLLCISCNTALGKLQDSPIILQKAINYLLLYSH